MTEVERRGLNRIKDLARKHILENRLPRLAPVVSTELIMAIQWIDHQQGIDERRRRPRSKYRRR